MENNNQEFPLNPGQRGVFIAVLTVVLFIVGALTGNPGEFPVGVQGTVFTPELVMSRLMPGILLAANVLYFFRVINMRIQNPYDPLKPGDILSLFKMKEFWVSTVASIAGIAQLFGLTLFDAQTQTMIVDVAMGLSTLLLRDWSERTGTRDDTSVNS